jgi:hypothetical protein
MAKPVDQGKRKRKTQGDNANNYSRGRIPPGGALQNRLEDWLRGPTWNQGRNQRAAAAPATATTYNRSECRGRDTTAG